MDEFPPVAKKEMSQTIVIIGFKKKVRRNFTVSDDRFFCMCLESFTVREEEHHVTQRHHLNNTVRANNELSKTGKGQRVVF